MGNSVPPSEHTALGDGPSGVVVMMGQGYRWGPGAPACYLLPGDRRGSRPSTSALQDVELEGDAVGVVEDEPLRVELRLVMDAVVGHTRRVEVSFDLI